MLISPEALATVWYSNHRRPHSRATDGSSYPTAHRKQCYDAFHLLPRPFDRRRTFEFLLLSHDRDGSHRGRIKQMSISAPPSSHSWPVLYPVRLVSWPRLYLPMPWLTIFSTVLSFLSDRGCSTRKSRPSACHLKIAIPLPPWRRLEDAPITNTVVLPFCLPADLRVWRPCCLPGFRCPKHFQILEDNFDLGIFAPVDIQLIRQSTSTIRASDLHGFINWVSLW